MARGNEAKEKLINKIIEATGDSYLGMYDKKYYFMSSENGEQVQVAISMTCPKTPVEFATNLAEPDGDWDFTDEKPKVENNAVANAAPAEITEEEVQNLQSLLEKLGL